VHPYCKVLPTIPLTYPEPRHVCCFSDSCMCLHTHLWQRMIGPDLRAALCAVSVWGRLTVCVLCAACHQPEGSAGVWRAHHCINGAPSSRSNVSPPPPVKKKKKTREKGSSIVDYANYKSPIPRFPNVANTKQKTLC